MSKQELVYQLLADGQPHYSEELAKISYRFSELIRRLRDEGGYEIQATQIKRYVWIYQLIGVKTS
jgi:hypothetical protein